MRNIYHYFIRVVVRLEQIEKNLTIFDFGVEL
jgi:hypothetical protein